MSSDRGWDVQRLFGELIEHEPAARGARLRQITPDPALASEVASLLAAADRAGDFLGLLGEPGGQARASEPGVSIAERYRIERPLGRGAMGEVYLAWDRQLERQVALKFLLAPRSADADAIARFTAEARAAARLEHPHVATVHDIDRTSNGRLFIVMAYYAGETLRALLGRGALHGRDALRIAAQIASALAAAHEAGIVHRDVKPANILFDAEGNARLADFGIAKLTDDETSRTGLTLGTIAYMSPEQARGDATDGRSDLWSLGVVLYEMLAGRRPFVGADAFALRRALMEDEPLPLDEDPTPRGRAVRAIVASLLERDPSRRPAHAADVRRSLDRLARDDAAAMLPGGLTLPIAVTSFIGRQRELALARELLGRTRLLTLTGPGGTGKTRLALELAAAVQPDYADGVCFVPLAEIDDAELAPSVIAHALGLRDLGGAPPLARVVAALRERRTLLVLDNFEQLRTAARFVATLLTSCPGVTVLVTSRAPLGVQGEQELPVPPLVTPARDGAYAAECEAVRLFVQRARAVRPELALDAESIGAIAEICRRLDGLPLALELAAARVRLLSPRAILARLEHSLALLQTDGIDRPARHRTMRAVIDWSYVLLSGAERTLFERLSIFAGGASLEAAQAMMPPSGDAAGTEDAALALLTSLCNESLLRQEPQPDGEPRFVMLEAVREFGLERLRASGDEGAARQAHRAYCLALAERAEGELRGPAQAAWFDRLEREYANFRVALDDALAQRADGLTSAVRLAVALHRHWLTRGPLLEGEDYLRRIIAAVDGTMSDASAPPMDARLRARLFGGAARLAGTRSLFPEARDLFMRSLGLYREVSDHRGIATTLNNLGWVIWIIGDLDAGKRMSSEAMVMHLELGDEQGVALSRNNLGWIAMVRGQFARAEEHFAASLATNRRRGDGRAIAYSSLWLGLAVMRRGEFARGIALYEDAIALVEPVADRGVDLVSSVRLAAARHALGEPGDHAALLAKEYLPVLRDEGRLWPLAYALTELGLMLRDAGDLPRARAAIEEALDVRRSTGARDGVAEAVLLLGTVCHAGGDRSRAREHFGSALEDARARGAAPTMLDCLEAFADLALDEGHAARATTLAAACASARDALGIPLAPRYERRRASMRSALREALGDEAFRRRWAEGACLALDDVARLALGRMPPDQSARR